MTNENKEATAEESTSDSVVVEETPVAPSVETGRYNEALRKVSAMESILKAHQIDTSVMTEEALSAIPVVDGVAGAFDYKPPKPASPAKPASVRMGGNKPVALTVDQIESMSETEINQRWSEVSAVLANGV